MSWVDEHRTPSGHEANHRRRRSDAERNTAKIVQAAMTVLAADPSASMQAVARESGLGRATVYRHFNSRQDLTAAIYRQSLDDAEAAIRSAIEDAPDTQRAFELVTQRWLSLGERYRMVVDHPRTDPGAREREQEVGVPLIALVERAQRDGLLREDMDARWLAATYSALLLQGIRFVIEPGASEDHIARLIVESWLAGARRQS